MTHTRRDFLKAAVASPLLLNVQDKAAPVLASFFPLPTNGPHTMHYRYVRSDLEIVTLQTYDLVTNPVTGSIDAALPPTQRVYLTRRGVPFG